MNPRRGQSGRLAAVLLLVALCGSGCVGRLSVKHRVLVDAINAEGVTKPTGLSYRFVPKTGAATPDFAAVVACLNAAFPGIGMYEAPRGGAPDLVIQVAFGADQNPRVDPAFRETFIHLSARANPRRALDRPTGPEVWDVRVGVLGHSGRMDSVMALLATVASEFAGMNTKIELQVEVPQNSPIVASVREAATRAIEEAQAAQSRRPPAAVPSK